MRETDHALLSFLLDERRFAIPLNHIIKVIRAVEVTQIPDSGELLYGVIDFHGDVIPVVNLRKRFSMDLRAILVDDSFVIIQTTKRKLVLVVDEVEEIIKQAEKTPGQVDLEDLLSGSVHNNSKVFKINGFLNDERGIIIIYDIEQILSSELAIQLDEIDEATQEKTQA